MQKLQENQPDKKTPPPKRVASPKQMSRKALLSMARPLASQALKTAADLMVKADNDSVRLGAAKVILAKVLPDMKSTELTTDEQIKFVLEIVQDNRLKDANRAENKATDKTLPETG